MKKIYTLGLVLMVLLSATLSATALQYKQKTLSNGDEASAVWSDGITNTFLNVFEAQGETDIYIETCTADFSSCKFGSKFTQEDVFDVNKKLTTATLSSVNFQLIDINTGAVENVNIQAQWTGVGDVTKSSSTNTIKSGDITEKFSSGTASRNANATGTINSQELGTSNNAEISEFKSVSIITIK